LRPGSFGWHRGSGRFLILIRLASILISVGSIPARNARGLNGLGSVLIRLPRILATIGGISNGRRILTRCGRALIRVGRCVGSIRHELTCIVGFARLICLVG
jgi:hypothetical protein